MSRIAALRQLHENEGLIAFAATWPGQVAVFAAACALVVPLDSMLGNTMLAALALVQIAPEQRRTILSLAGVAVIYSLLARGWDWQATADAPLIATPMPLVLGMVALVSATCFAVYQIALRFQALPRFVRRRPQLWLHALVIAVMLAVPVSGGAESDGARMAGLYAGALGYLVWRLGYLLQSGRRGKLAGSSFVDHFFYLLPVFGGTNVPYGKGNENLSRHEAKDAVAIAASQLAGLKLLVLVWLWSFAQIVIAVFVHGEGGTLLHEWFGEAGWLAASLDVPRMAAFAADAPGTVGNLSVRWASLFIELVTHTLILAIEGHLFVGMLRLYGFKVFRNTYKPLLAESLIDFWGRIHFYFKELLVEFFFMPTYVGRFRGRPRLRLFAAVFAAAFLGNFYFHVLAQGSDLRGLASAELATLFGPRAIYSFLLACGIYVSMLRQQERRGAPAPPGLLLRLRRIAGVWLFFALIHVYGMLAYDMPLATRNAFLLSLLGLG